MSVPSNNRLPGVVGFLPWGAAAAVMFIAAACPAQTYSVVDLGSISGPVSAVSSVNAAGKAVGWSMATSNGSNLHAYVWNGSSMTDIGTLPGDMHSAAMAINDSSEVVGVSYVLGEVQPRAFRWVNGVKSDLGSFTPRSISDNGKIAGTRTVPSGTTGLAYVDKACLWQNGALTNLGSLGGKNSYARGVNDAGWVVGNSQIADTSSASHAFVWIAGAMSDLGTLGGTNSQAYAINNIRQVAGVADTAAGKPHAMLIKLSASGGIVQKIDLGDLGGGASYAYSLNDAGQVVGTSKSKAFLWDGASMIDLNTRIPAGSGWKLAAAMDINADGVIVGNGTLHGFPRAFLLVPSGPSCPPLPPPGSVAATNGAYNLRVKVTWDAVAGAASYQIWRKPASGGPNVLLADDVQSIVYNDYSGIKCKQYRYYVRARRDCDSLSSFSTGNVGWRGKNCPSLSVTAIAESELPPPLDDGLAVQRPADLNMDGIVDVIDLAELLGAWGTCPETGCAADINGDGAVDAQDLFEVINDWG